MTLTRLTWSCATCLSLALFGCSRANPAFESGGDSGELGTDDSGESTTQTSTTQTSTTQTSAGDGDGDDDADTATDDPLDTGMEAPMWEDLPVEPCDVELHPGLYPRVGTASQFLGQVCPPSVLTHVRVTGSAGDNWLVHPCPNGCYSDCNGQTEWEVGVAGLPMGIAELFPMVPFDPMAPKTGCYFIEAVETVQKAGDICYFASFSIHEDEGAESPLRFHANRDSAGLTPGAVMLYGDWAPDVTDQDVPTCECELLGDTPCCPGSTVVAKQFMLGDPVLPGQFGEVALENTPFTFFGAQAQGGTDCINDPETSWALIGNL